MSNYLHALFNDELNGKQVHSIKPTLNFSLTLFHLNPSPKMYFQTLGKEREQPLAY